MVLRLHHVKPVKDAVYRYYRQIHIARLSAQDRSFQGIHQPYRMDRLVYWEKFKRVNDAIAREKQLKSWTRIKKIQLIVGMNPTWEDLAEGWFPELKEKENA